MTKKVSIKSKELNTIGEIINYAFTQFKRKKIYFGHGTNNPWDEAVYLVLSSLRLPINSSRKILSNRLKVNEKKRILDEIENRVKKRIPTAYLTNEAWFLGRSFYVDERVIIPRSPIAELIAKRFMPWINPGKVSRILDIGTGSGCIAISLAYAFPQAKIDAIDISPAALKVAEINCAKHKMTKKVRCLQSDLFKKLQCQKYDIIVSNPPYVSQKEMKALPKEYTHEPDLALFGGRNGNEIIDRIINDAFRYLSPKGILIVETGNSASKVMKKYKHLPFVWLEFEEGDSEVFLLSKEQLQSKDCS